MAYCELEPPEEQRGDLRTSLLAHLLTIGKTERGTKPPEVNWFMENFFDFGKEFKKVRRTEQDMRTILMAWKTQSNAAISKAQGNDRSSRKSGGKAGAGQ